MNTNRRLYPILLLASCVPALAIGGIRLETQSNLQLEQTSQDQVLKLEQSPQSGVGQALGSPAQRSVAPASRPSGHGLDNVPSRRAMKVSQIASFLRPAEALPALSLRLARTLERAEVQTSSGGQPLSVSQKFCPRPDLAWKDAERALAQNRKDEAFAIYTRMLETCSDAVRLATLQKAKGNFDLTTYEELLAKELPQKRSPDVEQALQDFLYAYRSGLLWHALEEESLGSVKTQINAIAPTLVARHDRALAENIGWYLLKEKLPQEAEPWFRRALEWGAEPARMGLALALQQQDKLEQAEPLLANARNDDARAVRAQIRFALADRAYQAGKLHEAQHWLALAQADGKKDEDAERLQAWLAFKQGHFEDAARRFETLYRRSASQQNADGLFYSMQRLGDRERLATLAEDPGPLGARIRLDEAERLVRLDQPHAAKRDAGEQIPWLSGIDAPSVGTWLGVRKKSGEAGLSKLDIYHEPGFDMDWSKGAQVFRLAIPRIHLDSGAMPANARFGSYQAATAHAINPRTNLDAGWEPEFSWRHEGRYSLFASIGTTPLNGTVAAAPTGKLGLGLQDEGRALSVAAFIEPVRDSILSYVGSRDPYSGAVWGRVRRFGLGAQGYTEIAPQWSIGGSLRTEALKGQSVADNTHLGVNAGLARNIKLPGYRYFLLGWDASYDTYAKNLNHFTWGHGGYFSPQQFLSIGPAWRFQTADGQRSIARGQATISWQKLKEDASPCFPISAPSIVGQDCGEYPANRSSGLAYSFELMGSYLITPQWMFSGALAWRRSESYRDQVAWIGVRYFFEPRGGLTSTDLPKSYFHSLY